MGGCCCSYSRRRADLSGVPVYYYCPQTLEEHESLSSNRGGASAIPAGLLIDRNSEIPALDTYRAPPTPLPYDVSAGTRHQNLSDSTENTKSSPITREYDSGCSLENLLASEDAEIDDKGKTKSDSDIIESEPQPPKSTGSTVVAVFEEDACPICLEEYDFENPRTITKCEHHFHLACILEWMERSDNCPICDQEMIFDQNLEL